MTDVVVKIGDSEFRPSLPLKFRAIKKIWPIAKRAEAMLERRAEPDFDALELASLTIEIVSVALIKNHPECTPDYIEENASMDDLAGLNDVFAAIMHESGFSKGANPEGEAPAEEGQASPSTVIGTE